MKYWTTLTCLLYLSATAQKTESYYDYNWKPCKPEQARFYCTIEKKDSGWLRNDYYIGTMHLQMQALYEDSACKIQNGYCTYFHANGVPSIMGRMIHNKQEGVCTRYHSNGVMADSAFFRKGIPAGSHLSWYPNGYLSDSISHANDSMDVHISWFDDGAIASGGYLLKGKLHGKWKFYHHNGQLSATEIYDHGRAVSKEYFKEDGTPLTDTAQVNRIAVFKKGGTEGWKKYMEKSLYWPRGYEFSNGNMAVVVIELTINEEGKPEDVEVKTPFHPEFDKIALNVIRSSPDWLPAIDHNRKVKSTFIQAVTFRQEE